MREEEIGARIETVRVLLWYSVTVYSSGLIKVKTFLEFSNDSVICDQLSLT